MQRAQSPSAAALPERGRLQSPCHAGALHAQCDLGAHGTTRFCVQMVAHLEAEVCPPGARVWPVQSVGWLSSCIDLGLHGYVTITSCKTDYVVLTTAAWDSLTHQSTTGSTIGGQQLLEVLPLTLAFYEVGEVRGLRILVRSSPVQSVRSQVFAVFVERGAVATAWHRWHPALCGLEWREGVLLQSAGWNHAAAPGGSASAAAGARSCR